mgnify:CR=1 FL=1
MNEILAYYQAITDGTVTVGRWTRAVYEYIVENNLTEKVKQILQNKK